MPNISRTPDYEVDLYNANTIRYVIYHVPSLCNALSCGFIHILALNSDSLRFWGEVIEVYYLKCKPLPIVKRWPFFISLSKTTHFYREVLLMLMGLSAPQGLKTCHGCYCFVALYWNAWNAYFAATTTCVSLWLHSQVLLSLVFFFFFFWGFTIFS